MRNRRWIWAIVALCLLQSEVSAIAQDSWSISEELNHSRDYILPSEILQVDRVVAKTPAGRAIVGAPADGSTVSYKAFNGIQYSLVQYNGRYVAFLVQPASLALGRFTIPELRVFIDRLDVLYQHYAEMMGREPAGSMPLLQMAFVDTCGGGCGYVGYKGVELHPNMLDPAHPEYPPDAIYEYAWHEMAHNFDFFSSFVMYGPDFVHAWTIFMQFSTNVYKQEGYYGDYPAQFLQNQLDRFFGPYVTLPNSSWTACVKDNACNNMAAATQGGMALRIGQLHGAAGVKAAIGYLRNSIVRRRLDANQMTILQKNDLLLESLAHGVGADVSCYADSWNWPISAALRSQLANAFGPNANCADQDGDGFSILRGDQDDRNPATYPGAAETVNGIDDDRNGIIDDVRLEETTEFPDSAPGTPVHYPVRIRGALAGARDVDMFQVVLQEETLARVRINSITPFEATLAVVTKNGTQWLLGGYTIPPNGRHVDVVLTAGSSMIVLSALPANQGGYELLVSPVASPRPVGLPSLTTPPASVAAGSGLTLGTPPLPLELEGVANLSARFWVESYGWAGIKNLDTNGGAALEWSPTTRFNHCGASYRVQFMAGDLPVSPISQPGTMPVQPECPRVTTQAVATIAAIVNAASFRTGARLSPGSIASLFGSNVGSIEQLNGFPAISMNGTSVSFDGILAPLFHVVGSQWIVMPGSMAQKMGLPTNCRARGADPVGYCGEPARPGDNISVFLTGLGKATRGGVANGTLLPAGLTAPADGNPLYRTVLQPTVTIGGVPAIVSYSGAAPGFAGLYQINLQIPAGVRAGDEVPLTVAMPDAGTIGNATLAIRAGQ